MNIFEAKHVLRSVGFNLTKNLNEDEMNGLDNIKYIDPEENLNIDMEDVLDSEAYEDDDLSTLDNPTDSDQFMAIEDALSDCGCDANQIAEIMTNCAETINEYLLDGMSPEEIAEKLAVDGCPECDTCEEAAIEEAKKIITKNGYKFIKESKKYAGKHPVFSGKEFQEYLIKECGTSCETCEALPEDCIDVCTRCGAPIKLGEEIEGFDGNLYCSTDCELAAEQDAADRQLDADRDAGF